jgi:hypothetical protein
MRTAGLFLTHVNSPRITEHYERLRRETAGLMDWTFAYNPGAHHGPDLGIPYPRAEYCMQARHAQAVKNNGVIGGYLDTVIIPCVLAIDAEFTWVMEYDVDFSGRWRMFFDQFDPHLADLLTTTVTSKLNSPDWYWWRNATLPEEIPNNQMFRAFLPILRISRQFAQAYRSITQDRRWGGHYEFLLPTIAVSEGFQLRDIGGAGADQPEKWASSNYVNDPSRHDLGPGTFLWRPARPSYFHEAPEDFELLDKLYHPIKPDVADWEKRSLL